MDIGKKKQQIRERIWNLLQEKRAARFPFPARGRIPNFARAEGAAELLSGLGEWKRAETLKINPDSPQKKIREMALAEGKSLIMPTPRLREGFLLLRGLKGRAREACSISGAFKYGKLIEPGELPKIDLIVNGSVAVALDGARLGKGHGYGEIEYAISRELGSADEATPVLTTVHELQIVEAIPLERHDVPVDIVITPERVVRTHTKHPKPPGILWELVTEEMLEAMPLLRSLRDEHIETGRKA